MCPKNDDDWSDSDDEDLSDVETNVQLGLPDGLLESPEDLRDARVSRIGGHPVRTTSDVCIHHILTHTLCLLASINGYRLS